MVKYYYFSRTFFVISGIFVPLVSVYFFWYPIPVVLARFHPPKTQISKIFILVFVGASMYLALLYLLFLSLSQSFHTHTVDMSVSPVGSRFYLRVDWNFDASEVNIYRCVGMNPCETQDGSSVGEVDRYWETYVDDPACVNTYYYAQVGYVQSSHVQLCRSRLFLPVVG